MIALILAFACLPVDGPKLLARHFAAALPAFSQLAPETEIAYAPVPGAVRVMRAAETQRLAQKFGLLTLASEMDVCFEWPMRPLDPERIAAAMKESLPEAARIEVLDFSRAPVPDGKLEFPASALQGNLWRGSVRYSDTGRLDVWARVKANVRQTRIVTVTPVRSGDVLKAEQLQVEEFEDTPIAGLVTKLEEASGLVVRRPLPAGSVLRNQYLEQPHAVVKGDTVRLHAFVGRAHVTTAVSAQAQGRVGDIIPVKNASSGRVMRARIEAPGEVRLTP